MNAEGLALTKNGTAASMTKEALEAALTEAGVEWEWVTEPADESIVYIYESDESVFVAEDDTVIEFVPPEDGEDGE